MFACVKSNDLLASSEIQSRTSKGVSFANSLHLRLSRLTWVEMMQ